MAAETTGIKGKELLFLVASLFMAPMILLYFAIDYFEQKSNSRLIESARIKLMEPLNQIKYYKNNETFWCATLNGELNRSRDHKEMARRIERLAQITGEPLKYVIWPEKRKAGLSNFLTKDQLKDWDNLLFDARNIHGTSDTQARMLRENSIRKLLGPHYMAEQFNRSKAQSEPYFIRPDLGGHHPYVWLNDGEGKDRTGAVVLLQHEILTRDHRLKLLANSWQNSNSQLYHIDTERPLKFTGKHATLIKAACFEFIANDREISQYSNKLVGVARISKTGFVANLIEIEGYRKNSGRNTLLVALLTLFMLVLAFRTWPDILQPGNVSIRLQLLVMLFICSGLPLLLLAIGALEHLEQRRDYLVRSAYQSCLENIQAIDLRSSSEFSHVVRMSYDAINKFKRLYLQKASELDIITSTFRAMHPSRSEFRAVASSSEYMLTHTGVYHDGFLQRLVEQKSERTKAPIELNLIQDIGSYYLNFFNGVPINPDHYTEVELLTEMFYQRNLTEIVHDLILMTDNIAPMGWGSTNFPVFINLISLNDPRIADFFFTAGYTPDQISRTFTIRHTDNMRRNEAGLSVFLFDKFNVFPLDQSNRHEPELRSLFARLGTHPSLEPQRCTYAGEDWIYAGYQGNLIYHFSLIAMYPVSRIDAAISTEREFITYSAMAALVILISLTLLFAHSFTVPLAHLQTAAEAVEKRDFDFKLPDLGHDEFGEMGRIFNKSIAELEELSLASIVQSRLMPAHTIASGRFDVFGRSVPMADLGGDYFDYFSIDDSRFAVLLGDVAGHGVGASLIMAMAKTAVVCCKDFHDQPLKIIDNLHRLISTTRSKKQRKIMTFQYLCFDKTTGLGKYSNAGGCSPMLVCPDAASVSEITLSGPVLGGMKNSRFSEAELQMQPGQALVLYTDGVIEGKNPAGDEIGFDRFKQWLIDHYHADATAYYNAVYEEYLRWLAGGNAQDDLTLIILVYQNKKP